MAKRILVTGLGFITCVGNSREEVSTRLRELKSGIRKVDFLGNPDLPVKVAGNPQGFSVNSSNWRNWSYPDAYSIDRSMIRSLPPQGVYAVCGVEQALADAGLEKGELKDGATGLYCASVGSPLLLHENLSAMRAAKGERGNPMGVLCSVAGTLNFNLGSWLGIRGTNCGYVSACASGAHAIGYAMDDIALGRQKRAIVVGAEEATAESLLPFSAMRALSTCPDPARASRPFDRDRDGFVGAGGATVLILEEEEFAQARGAVPYAELAGWGQGSDGYHRASPHPEGEGLAEAMKLCLAAAGMDVSEIDHVSAHATSTSAGDKAEATAIGTVFKDRLEEVSVSSPKGLTGHSLSMAGALEAAICCLMLKEGFVLGNVNLDNVDPACSHLNLPRRSEACSLSSILNNSSGFGGSNVCNVLRRCD
ncbi:beta-ketoacyl-[acyl-carrier-protein] synthase family protein [Pelagicoccus sp. SDUM812002]|uniref:beta-ketoacyl-[acyl-carrier-protein] synthase family protein n=1 Tax=Pelagicoccus sp. SDUM812002 TaxID=3041266 RepID=UPI00280DBFE2|nr:beta-ketoacyl-[acyl-carrier-protein] synthase family protein [Pelagicoccus sp. SDUM812002]MDQ8186359.1 beta-ketoacyl-[acyl-carrier-protein] synthase family protein [Pelagicoccus sp. SDUM812002]